METAQFQQIRLTNSGLLGTPGLLPDNLAGLSDDVLADLSAHIVPAPPGLDGMGFWPVVVTTPSYDATTQVVVPPATYSIDPGTRTVTGTATIRAMTADEYRAANPVPSEVTNWQARAVLLTMPATDGKSTTLEDQVDAAVHGSGNRAIIVAWEYGNTFLRHSPFVESMAGALGLSEQQIDDLFRAAALQR